MTRSLAVPHAIAEIYRQAWRERKHLSLINNKDCDITKDVPDTKLAPGSGIQTGHKVDIEKDAEGGNKWYQRDLDRVISSNQRK